MSETFEIAVVVSSHRPNLPAVLRHGPGNNTLSYRTTQRRLHLCSVLVQRGENGKLPRSEKSGESTVSAQTKSNPKNTLLLNQTNTVGVIGGVSVFSTLIFLEKLVCWSSRNTKNFFPFVVCNDPALNLGFQGEKIDHGLVIENLGRRRLFLEHAGAGCIVMPCHISHVWHKEIFEGCSVQFLHIADCVAHELGEARMKPIETGNKNVRIGLICTDEVLNSGFYQEKLQNQGFEVVLPDKATTKNILIPAVETLRRRDVEGARNLLRIAIHVLLVKAANAVVLASDELQGLLPLDDPLLTKCIDPMDSLARSTIAWATSPNHTASKIVNPADRSR